MTSYTANGGTRSSSGSLANFGAYTGVPIMDLLNLVGGVTSSNTIKVTASDGYTSTYTYDQLSGTGIATYDSTGATATPTQGLTMIVAYYLNGTSLASNVGPLRTMFVGPDDLYSSGNMNAKMVVKLEVL
jgi:DMSO/TMAO reductase YedYZ molybdopterin-dependent catalytic subunit